MGTWLQKNPPQACAGWGATRAASNAAPATNEPAAVFMVDSWCEENAALEEARAPAMKARGMPRGKGPDRRDPRGPALAFATETARQRARAFSENCGPLLRASAC